MDNNNNNQVKKPKNIIKIIILAILALFAIVMLVQSIRRNNEIKKEDAEKTRSEEEQEEQLSPKEKEEKFLSYLSEDAQSLITTIGYGVEIDEGQYSMSIHINVSAPVSIAAVAEEAVSASTKFSYAVGKNWDSLEIIYRTLKTTDGNAYFDDNECVSWKINNTDDTDYVGYYKDTINNVTDELCSIDELYDKYDNVRIEK